MARRAPLGDRRRRYRAATEGGRASSRKRSCIHVQKGGSSRGALAGEGFSRSAASGETERVHTQPEGLLARRVVGVPGGACERVGCLGEAPLGKAGDSQLVLDGGMARLGARHLARDALDVAVRVQQPEHGGSGARCR